MVGVFKKRTHTCGELSLKDVGKEVILNGWIHKIRYHGNLIFIDLRDRYGITQLVVDKSRVRLYNDFDMDTLTKESVIWAKGLVKERPEPNRALSTGEIEVHITELGKISISKSIPIDLSDDTSTGEEMRLRYRYLDLRRKPLMKNVILRHKIVFAVRKYLNDLGFVEIETPILTKSTPEGARDFLVPSRLHPGKFYALPQSPQQMKQLLMISGFDRYFQIARCFRDEDLRADRQPEFTQIDLEMSFVDEQDIMEVVEGIIKTAFNEAGIEIKTPFPKMDYYDAMNKYGIDRPDLRFKLEMFDATVAFKNSSFKIFSEAINKQQAIVKALIVKKGSRLTRKQLTKLEHIAKEFGAKGLAYVKFSDDKQQVVGTIARFWPEIKDKIISSSPIKIDNDDLILFVCDKWKIAVESLGRVRLAVFDMIRQDTGLEKYYLENGLIEYGYKFVWIVNFPLFTWSEEEQRYVSEHHPFTMPQEEYIEELFQPNPNLDKIKARAYDIVLNGIELGGGSIRIHDPELQKRIFQLLKLSEKDIKEKFGNFVEAFNYGAPVHGGLAIGLDRLVAMIVGSESIRDVIAFPKNSKAESLFDGAPSYVSKDQLDELHIGIKRN